MSVAGNVPLPPRIKRWGAQLKDVRDIALVGFGGVYAFGYLARALHAWANNLGVLPGVELQYFVGGSLLLVPPALVLAALYGLWRLFQGIASWEAKGPQRRHRIDSLLAWLLIAGVTIFLVSGADSFARRVPAHGLISTIAMVMLFGVFSAVFLLATVRHDSPVPPRRSSAKLHLVSRVLERIGVFLSGVFVVNLGLVVILLLVLAMIVGTAKVLPVLPQALGGAAPRCAQFDVDATGLTRELIGELFDPGAPPDASATTKRPRRSRQVLVLYSGGDSVLFKLADDAREGGATYELKRSAIDAVLWCGRAAGV